MKVTAKDIKEHRTKCTEFYSRVISMKLSHYLSAFCIRNNISPNTVTAMMLPATFICVILLLQENFVLQITGAFLLFTVNILDTSDGEVARYTGKNSIVGIYYDKLFQVLADILVFLVIAYNQYKYFGDLIYILPLGIVLLFYIIDNYSKEVFAFLKEGNSLEIAKKTKLAISFDKSSKLQFFAHITSSNTGFFHIYWIFLLVDFILSTNFTLQFIFILYFMLLQVIKTLNRQIKIIKNLKK